jgi:alkaline phosphatase D
MKPLAYFSLASLALAAALAPLPAAEIVDEIAFGSCLKPVDHPMLDRVLTLPMDLFIFLGDNIYADTEDMAVMRAKYDALKTSRFFRELRRRVPVLATWDDHDMGANDAGAEYPKKREAKEEFLRWLDEPVDSPRRQREGIYDAHIFGPAGKRVQVILLDTRTFRGPLKRVPKAEQKLIGGPYIPSPDTSIPLLGEPQWRWLREQLSQPAELRLIASSIQFVSEFSGAEAWANLPHEKQRLLDLLRETRAGGVLFISGDRHWCELSRMDGPLGYPLYDLTASALTEPHPRGTPSENRYRALPTTYHDVNVGHLYINWQAGDPVITWRIIDVAGRARIEHQLRLSELQPTRGR